MNGKITIWDIKNQTILKELGQLETSVEHVRTLMKEPTKCLVYSSAKPEVSVFDMNTSVKEQIYIPNSLGQCTRIIVEKSENVFVSIFTDGSVGIFNIN